MQRAASVNRITHANSALSRSPSVRAIYVNEQTSKRSVNTLFHSPFRDGRRNRDYANPSFVSNHLLYPKEMLSKEEVVVRKNYIPQQSELRKEQLYRKRMNTEVREQKAIKERVDKFIKGKAVDEDGRNGQRGLRLMDNQQKLKRQLNLLQNYRHLQASQVKHKQSDAIPPYFEKYRRDYNHQLQQHQKRQRTMRQFMETNRQQCNMRREQARRQAEKQNQNVQKNIEVHTQKLKQRQSMARSTSSLLGNILKEQMLTRQQSKGLI